MKSKIAFLFFTAFCVLACAEYAVSKESSDCPNPKNWQPSTEELKRRLEAHQAWLATNEPNIPRHLRLIVGGVDIDPLASAELKDGPTRAILCNLRVQRDQLEVFAKINLSWANLERASLSKVDLSNSKLIGANMREAGLDGANLAGSDLSKADLSEANLDNTRLEGSLFFNTLLKGASASNSNARGANVLSADASGARFVKTDFSDAKLIGTSFTEANLDRARLDRADLTLTNFKGARLVGTFVADAIFNRVDLTNSIYAPASAPPKADSLDITGLDRLRFLPGTETGLVQIRGLFKTGGLREAERLVTASIERGRTARNFVEWQTKPLESFEGIFRYAAFDLTTEYGASPGRAIELIFFVGMLLIPIYARAVVGTTSSGYLQTAGIYLIQPKDRIARVAGKLSLDGTASVKRIMDGEAKGYAWAAYFSLLSAFNIGFRELTVGAWLSRLQRRPFLIESLGWVRTLSGVQSLLSMYLLAIWALTYFGRPFE